MGEWVGRLGTVRNVRDEGSGGGGERPGGEGSPRIVEGREREPLALRRIGQRRAHRRKPQRPLEVGRGELDLDERFESRGRVRNVRNEGRGGAGERARRPRQRCFVGGRERDRLALRRARPRFDHAGIPERPLEVGRIDLDLGQRFG